MKTNNESTTSLIHGSDIIARRLRLILSPMGWLFKFNPKPPHRPRPLSLTLVLLIFSTIFAVIFFDYISLKELADVKDHSSKFDLILESKFILRMFKIFRIYSSCFSITVLFITVAHHSSIANVMANNNNYATLKDQEQVGRACTNVFLFKSLANSIMFVSIVLGTELSSSDQLYYIPLSVVLITFINMTLLAPVIYTCYLGACLGKHVENFSSLYIDTMFDQFLKAAELGEGSEQYLSVDDIAMNCGKVNSLDEDNKKSKGCLSRLFCCCSWFCIVGRFFKRVCRYIFRKLREIAFQLNSRKYPELPEMKMTKLSSTTNIKISEQARNANSLLLRNRLRKTQVMLGELRDLVSDINKMSSPVILMVILYETILIVVISTASVQGRLFKSISPLILPAIVCTIGLTVVVVHICTCLDDTIGSLKLMMNKLFDFIIMNHRVQTVGPDTLSASTRLGSIEALEQYKSSSDSEIESEALSETWSQFQYTRKLSNTIQFTMGGILPVTRRLVLLILGHILSAVFISIEIMSIIDTSQSPVDKTTLKPPDPLKTTSSYSMRRLNALNVTAFRAVG